ncbi:hypothetical protein GCM10010495_15260 [Kitasatospora herbaricolor]|uniref:glycine cleavage system protein H n=1 Tax=Kitasatospora herbaricolor TaxID=68217 RepID=UPI0019C93BF8|nr:hypothetical protein [Kitasatospora herbaricolor]MDQ0309328.1 hypothetical protein [Kitasatospora herbaricolor]GGV04458.1 hypothetical protein GCM10010495_15260 [Kitasatospora herbaricolor]
MNEDLGSDPEYLNTDPYGEGWIVQVTMSDPKHLDELLTAAEYADYIREESADQPGGAPPRVPAPLRPGPSVRTRRVAGEPQRRRCPRTDRTA